MEREGREWKGERGCGKGRGLDFDIWPGAPDFLVTPLRLQELTMLLLSRDDRRNGTSSGNGNKTPTWEREGKVKVISKQDIAVST